MGLHKFEERFPTISLIIGGLGLLIVAGIVFGTLGYVADQLSGAGLGFLLLLAFFGGFAAHGKWLDTESGRKYYEDTWKRQDATFKRPVD